MISPKRESEPPLHICKRNARLRCRGGEAQSPLRGQTLFGPREQQQISRSRRGLMEPQIARYEPRGRPLTPHGGLSVSLSLSHEEPLDNSRPLQGPFSSGRGGGEICLNTPPPPPTWSSQRCAHRGRGGDRGTGYFSVPPFVFPLSAPLCNLWEWRM